MKKFKLYGNFSKKAIVLILSGAMIFIPGCKREDSNQNQSSIETSISEDDLVTVEYDFGYEKTSSAIKELFPELKDKTVKNSTIITLLDEIAPKDENNKINADGISKFKAKLDVDNMMADFNSFLDILEQTMIEKEELISTSDLVLEKDKEVLAKIEAITSNIIKGNKEEKQANFELVYNLFVKGEKVEFDGLAFEIADLSYSTREYAEMYARTAAYFSRKFISEEQYKSIDNRTDNQNSKSYIKITLEVLSNDMEEVSFENVEEVFNTEYKETIDMFNEKINISEENTKNFVNYLNLEYLDSDMVSNKDKNSTLGEYEDEKVSNVLLTIDAITEYNANNTNNIILLSKSLVSPYANLQDGAIDTVVLDYIQFNSIMLLNTTNEEMTKEEIFNNVYFNNIYNYIRKANFTHKYSDDKQVDISYQNISESTKLYCDRIVYYTLNKRPKIKGYSGIAERMNENLEESIQYIQNTITGECKNVELESYVKTK